MSYVDQDGEWKFRKISLMGVVKSFVSQLRPGQDLTRVSLPSVLLHPYSILEVVGYRELTYFELLLGLNAQDDPQDRMLTVLKWVLSTIQQETFHKKPYNPVLGETLECHIQSDNYSKTEFIAEQVSHHPPISAFIVMNHQENVSLSGNISFNVKFGGNHVNVVTEGPAQVNVENRVEQYELSKMVPDMVVKNVVWGTKRIFWSGDLSISCSKTGYLVNLLFKDNDQDNIVKGTLSNMYKPELGDIFTFEGKCGGVIYMTNKRGERKVLIDVESVKKPRIIYQPRTEMDFLASLNVWAEVSKYIVENDMEKADECKKRIEQEQRQRIAERKAQGIDMQSKYFAPTEFGWVFKGASGAKKGSILDDSDEELEMDSDNSPPRTAVAAPRNVDTTDDKPERKRISPNSSKEDATKKSDSVEKVALEEKKEPKEDRPLSPTMGADRKNSSPEDLDKEDLKVPKLIVSKSGSALGTTPPSERHMGRHTQTRQVPVDREDSEEENHISKRGSLPMAITKNSSAPVLGTKKSLSLRMSWRKDNNNSTSKEELFSKEEKKRLREEAKTQLSTKPNLIPGRPVMAAEEVTIHEGWMKMRNSMKIWVSRYFVLRPGKIIYYKDDKDVSKDRCAGILRLADCKVKERLSTKDGYSFKIYHLLHYPIYHKYGLRGETLKLAMLPVSWNYCIVRVNTKEERKAWIDNINQQIGWANEHDRASLAVMKDDDFYDMEEDDKDEDEDERVFSSPDPEKEKPLEEGTDIMPVPPPLVSRELSEDMFMKQESFHRNLVGDLNVQQKAVIKSIQQKTLQAVEQWKKEMDMRLMAMEKRLTTSVQTQTKPSQKVALSYLQLFIVIVLCLVIGRLTAASSITY